MTQLRRVLIVDEDVASANVLRNSLAQGGYKCEIASSGDSALKIVQKQTIAVAVCDVRLLGMYEFELLSQLKKLQPTLPVIVETPTNQIPQGVEAVKHGALHYIEKSVDCHNLLGLIAHATPGVRRQRKSTPPSVHQSTPPPQGRLTPPLATGELVHASVVMRELVASIALVARSSAPALILGESGTGKELVARAIHAGGHRASQPFIVVNTSAIPEQLLESELFGHERGAFTGATRARRGLLHEANGGTLFLDEIGDMPLMLQPKLLRVLQFGETRAVGSDRIGKVDVRIIAATHRDLGKLVNEGRFREDLRYRLNVIPLVVPPLRNRREGIGPLVELFLQQARGRNPYSPVSAISDEAMMFLTHAAWPGNVRELENAIERIVVLGDQEDVTLRDLAFLDEKPPGETWPDIEEVPWTLKQLSDHYLNWVLKRTAGNKVRAAKILGVDLSTLYRWSYAKK